MDAATDKKSISSRDKLYESIIDDVRKIYGGKLSEAETHTAARNLIEFYKVLLE